MALFKLTQETLESWQAWKPSDLLAVNFDAESATDGTISDCDVDEYVLVEKAVRDLAKEPLLFCRRQPVAQEEVVSEMSEESVVAACGPLPLHELPKYPTLEAASVQKDWHAEVNTEIRNYIFGKLINEMGSTARNNLSNVFNALKIEKEIYEIANDRKEYFHKMAQKVLEAQVQKNGKKEVETEEWQPSAVSLDNCDIPSSTRVTAQNEEEQKATDDTANEMVDNTEQDEDEIEDSFEIV